MYHFSNTFLCVVVKYVEKWRVDVLLFIPYTSLCVHIILHKVHMSLVGKYSLETTGGRYLLLLLLLHSSQISHKMFQSTIKKIQPNDDTNKSEFEHSCAINEKCVDIKVEIYSTTNWLAIQISRWTCSLGSLHSLCIFSGPIKILISKPQKYCQRIQRPNFPQMLLSLLSCPVF